MLKRIICLIISIIFILYGFSGCNRKGISKVAITPVKQNQQSYSISWNENDIKPCVQSYSINEDLSNVSNAEQFPELDHYDRYMLYKNLFLIKKPSEIFEQPFSIYQKNRSEGIPDFITSDSILHLYHYMYDYVIRNIEKERLIDELKAFTQEAFNQSIAIYNGVTDKNVKKAALKNIAYFGIAMKLLDIDLPGGVPLEASRMIDNDVKRVRLRWESGTSEIFPYYIDYKDYTVRGHYSRENNLRNYFLAMTWYSSTPIMFDMYDEKTEAYRRMDEQIVMAVIMVSGILCDENLRSTWEDLYNITSTYFGKKGDIALFDLSDIIKVIYGEKVNLNRIWDEEKIQKVYELAKQRYNVHSGEAIGGRISLFDSTIKQQVQFKLMGSMYNIDLDIYNKLTDSKQGRPLPNGLDVAAAFGSDEAYTMIREYKNEDYGWDGYNASLHRLRGVLSGVNGDNPEDYSLNNLILWILKPYTGRYEDGCPSFLTNEYYKYKNLITYLGALTDMRHISYLQARQGGAKASKPGEVPQVPMPGYVEPNVKIYERLEYASLFIKSFLSENGIENSQVYDVVNNFKDMAAFLKSVSIKELGNVPLSDEDKKRIREYGEELKSIMLKTVESKGETKEWEQLPQAERSMASVGDAFQNENQVFQTAVGYPDYIYAVVPYMDELYIVRGSVYSYYEFVEPVSRKLDDKDWQDSLREGEIIEQPIWTKKIRR